MTPSFTPPTAAFPDSAPDDPSFSSVKLLLHCDGTDGSTTFTDVAGHTVTPSGNVQIDTAQSKFGGASAYFPAAGDYLSITTGSEFNFGAGDFTIEFWLRCEGAWGSWRPILDKTTTWNSNSDFRLEITTAGLLQFWAGDSAPLSLVGGTVLLVDTWYHVAMCRRGGLTSLYLDGTLIASTAAGATIPNDKTTLRIGCYSDGTTYGLGGWIDDLRITAGVARYAPIPPAVVVSSGTAVRQFTHTWAAQDRATYPITTQWSADDPVESYPVYAVQDGVKYTDLPRNGRIAGSLLNDGVAQADTWVFLTYRASNQVVAAKKTAADGSFEFAGLHPTSRYLVSAYQSRTEAPGANMVSADYVLPVPD